MTQQSEILDKLFGIILTVNKTEQSKIMPHVNKDWFITKFHKDVFEGMKQLNSEGTFIDLITLTTWLRENNKFQKDYVLKVAQLTNGIGISDTLHVNSILNQCFYNYSIRQSFLMVKNVHEEIQKDNPSKQIVINEIDKLKDILSDSVVDSKVNNFELIDKVLERHEMAKKGIPLGITLGWNELEKQILLEPDDLMVVGGRPAMGKTAWSISLLRNLVFDQNRKVVFFSLEMAKDRILRRIISLLTGIDSNKIKYGRCNDYEMSQIQQLKANPKWNNLWIFDGSHTVNDISHEVTTVQNENEIDLIVVDYLQKITPEKSDSRYHEVTKISNGVKRMIMQKRIPCIALAQLSRDSGRTGKRPTLPDLKESGEIEQDASIVSFLHRPEYYGEEVNENGESMLGIGEFITAKNRDGSIGIVEMKVNLETSDWADYKREENVNFDSDFISNKLNGFNSDEPF